MTCRPLGLLALLWLLAGCQRAETPGVPTAAVAPAETPAAVDQPGGDVPPATAPPGSLPPRLRQDPATLARWDGYGDVRLGVEAAQIRTAWGGELLGSPAAAGGCYLLRPRWAETARQFGFMVEGDRLVRYQTSEPKETAPGGGRVGMSVAQLQALYPALQVQAHKYVEGAQTLRVAAPDSDAALVFETDAQGEVTQWRVGLPPQVDYVEGCG
ncbi:hypothetical protein [Xanthomonas maliensis]|uniref:hypothetical protein n=1 Tax=Xanthomonas maliensis TaxID=1321368 RepID=UPI0003A3D497|nr:hypothetical protein [Xanthomonas maliensis]KAB7768587.1 lectin [Xanthomonas maliensis]